MGFTNGAELHKNRNFAKLTKEQALDKVYEIKAKGTNSAYCLFSKKLIGLKFKIKEISEPESKCDFCKKVFSKNDIHTATIDEGEKAEICEDCLERLIVKNLESLGGI